MNALDLLVDFAIETSTSATVMKSKGDSDKQDTLASQCIGSSPNFEQNITPPPIGSRLHEVALGDWSRYKPTSSAQCNIAISSPKLSSLSDKRDRPSADMAMYTAINQPPTNPPKYPIAQTFNPRIEKEPGRYCEYKCGATYSYCTGRVDPLLKAFHTFGYVMPIEEGYCLPPRPLPEVRQQFDLPNPEDEFPCRNQDRLWNCQTFHPHSYSASDGCVPMVVKEHYDDTNYDNSITKGLCE
ncbi:Nn.00g114400.m01.CDS01 [Neocucurbitaria sp. VM-36]